MPKKSKPDPKVEPRPPADDPCDLCGSFQREIVADEAEGNCRIALCRKCGLMYASPRLAEDELARFYEESFLGDAGSAVLAEDGRPRVRKVSSEEKTARRWSIPLVLGTLDVAGKKVLDLRSRSGALSEGLARAGADVVTIDPFQANAAYAKEVRGLCDVRQIPFTRFHELESVENGEYDVVVALTVHLLAHLRSPRRLLERVFEVLRPGGHLIIAEKDVLRPGRRIHGPNLFNSGKAHQFQLTEESIALYLRMAGFELLRCGLDARRVTSQNHVVTAVARKPSGATAATGGEALVPGDISDPGRILTRVRRVQSWWRWHRVRGLSMYYLRKLARRAGTERFG